MDNDTLCLGDNFVSAEILDNGPLRITFRLLYAPYKVGKHSVTETRIISLDAYSLFNKVTNIFETDTVELAVATGIVLEKDMPEVTYGMDNGIIAYEVPDNEVNGTIYTAAIHPGGFSEIEVAHGHFLGLNQYEVGTPYTYYAGGGWSKAGFGSFDDWVRFINQEKEKINQPLTLQIK